LAAAAAAAAVTIRCWGLCWWWCPDPAERNGDDEVDVMKDGTSPPFIAADR
jgi:Pyruvate/2-oxoacid:ferredoxin oxidoreductase delta subunit